MGEQTQRMDSFRLLLNEISHELTEENVQCLVHISGVPGGSRKQIKDGLALFNYLITQDFISREKIGNLRNLLRKIRPRRKDLVRLVDSYIKKEFQTNDVRSVLDDFSDSWEQIPEIESGSRVTVMNNETAVFKIDCAYLNCVCRRVPSCYTPFIIILLLAIIATALFWFGDVTEVSDAIKSNSDLKSAGVYILLAEILALLVVIGVCTRGKLASCLPCRRAGYVVLSNPSIQEGPAGMISSQSSSAIDRVASAPRQYKVSEGSESAVFSSYASTMDDQHRVDMNEHSDRS